MEQLVMGDAADQLFAMIERIELEFKMCKSIVMDRDKCMAFFYPAQRERDQLFCMPSKEWLGHRHPYKHYKKQILLTDFGHVAIL